MLPAILFIFHVLAIFYPVYAFINVESLRQHEEQGFKGKLKLGLTGRSGNVSKFQGRVGALHGLRHEKKEYLLLGKYRYGQINNVKNTHEGNIHFRFTYYFSQFFPLETYGQMEFDQFKRLNVRKIIGSGLRFELAKTKKHFFYLGWGGFYEYEKTGNIALENTQRTFRGSLYLTYLFLPNRQKEFSLVVYYQPDMAVFSDYRLQIDGGLSISLSGPFSLENKLSFRRDNHPPAEVKADDTSYLTGISYRY